MKSLTAFFCGIIFALGLGISGMTRTHIVKGFLDVFGAWNVRLIGVMIGAIVVHALAFRIIKRCQRPLLDETFHLPKKVTIDGKLLLGAAFFGLGWGWVGICPGPAIVSLASGSVPIFLFVIAMILGMLAFKALE